MPKLRNHCYLYLIVCVMFLLPPGVHAAEPAPAEPSQTSVRITFKRAAVASFLVGRRQPQLNQSADQTLACPLRRICVDDPSILPHAGITLTRLVDQQLRLRFGQQVLPRQEVKTAETGLKLNPETDTPLTMAKALGRALDVDVVVMGTVWRYRDRTPAQSGMPDRHASVAFAVYMINVSTGRIIWNSLFDETQKPLTDNLLEAKKQIKMGLKWLSADELAQHGVRQVFASFPTNILPGNYKQ